MMDHQEQQKVTKLETVHIFNIIFCCLYALFAILLIVVNITANNLHQGTAPYFFALILMTIVGCCTHGFAALQAT